jgi:regulator of replication initiation timing
MSRDLENARATIAQLQKDNASLREERSRLHDVLGPNPCEDLAAAARRWVDAAHAAISDRDGALLELFEHGMSVAEEYHKVADERDRLRRELKDIRMDKGDLRDRVLAALGAAINDDPVSAAKRAALDITRLRTEVETTRMGWRDVGRMLEDAQKENARLCGLMAMVGGAVRGIACALEGEKVKP